jgi:hypothetical protein
MVSGAMSPILSTSGECWRLIATNELQRSFTLWSSFGKGYSDEYFTAFLADLVIPLLFVLGHSFVLSSVIPCIGAVSSRCIRVFLIYVKISSICFCILGLAGEAFGTPAYNSCCI